ncbi:NAD(P)/FAD-dependent oxidoreductase [Jatrophihabitans sp. DSM 45814]
MEMSRRRVAVIGSGVAGLTAAYILQREADVTLFEADSRLGGHAHTHELLDPAGSQLNVDTGFIVHNARTYPYLIRLFAELEVATQDSEMSMSISCGGCGLEYAGARGLSGLFPAISNAGNPRYLYLLTEVTRFHRRARATLAKAALPGETELDAESRAVPETMREFLQRGRFSAYFRSHFVTPLISAVWSCSPSLALEYPAEYLFEFLDNHGMLSVSGSPEWRTVVGGSARYVAKAAKQLSAVHTSTPVRSVSRSAAGVLVRDDADQLGRYDAAVIATHPAQALNMLAAPSATEAATLGAITYSVNPAVLHSDPNVLPRAVRAHASWNYYLPSCDAAASNVHVTYDMNRLQRLATETPYLVTLNDQNLEAAGGAGCQSIADDLVLARMVYEHPIFTPDSVAAQSDLPALSDSTIAFAGAYHGWGFHEDGCRSGVVAASSLGVHW